MSTTVHASAILVGTTGVLIRGESGSGKSSLALALIEAETANRFVADDRVILDARHGRLLASVPPAIAGLVELRGLGLIRLAHVSPVLIGLVVDLLPLDACPRLPTPEEASTTVEGVTLKRLAVPVGAPDGAMRVRLALRHGIGVADEVSPL